MKLDNSGRKGPITCVEAPDEALDRHRKKTAGYSEPVILLQPTDYQGHPAAATKLVYTASNGSCTVSKPKQYTYAKLVEAGLQVSTAAQFFDAIRCGANANAIFVIGRLRNDPEVHGRIKKTGLCRRTKTLKSSSAQMRQFGYTEDPAFFEEFARRGYCIDFDPSDQQLLEMADADLNVYKRPAEAVSFVIQKYLSDEFHGVTVLVQLSSSSGKTGPHHVNAHIFFWLDRPLMPEVIKRWVNTQNARLIANGYLHKDAHGQHNTRKKLLDIVLYNAVQPHYIPPPIYVNGDDPIKERWHVRQGNKDEVSPVILSADEVKALKGDVFAEKNVEDRYLKYTQTSAGDIVPLVDDANWPKLAEDCEKLIGDGPELRGFMRHYSGPRGRRQLR